MAKDAKKVKTKAKINWGWDAPENRKGKATRSTKNKIDITDNISRNVTKKSRRRKKGLGFKAILIILLVALIGGAIGAGACWFVSRNDCFEIIGRDEITLMLRADGEEFNKDNSYCDDGVKIVSFGRDISSSAIIETDLKQNEDGRYYADKIGTYYIIYKVNDIKYGKVFTLQRIRLITFVEPKEPDINVEPDDAVTTSVLKHNVSTSNLKAKV